MTETKTTSLQIAISHYNSAGFYCNVRNHLITVIYNTDLWNKNTVMKILDTCLFITLFLNNRT